MSAPLNIMYAMKIKVLWNVKQSGWNAYNIILSEKRIQNWLTLWLQLCKKSAQEKKLRFFFSWYKILSNVVKVVFFKSKEKQYYHWIQMQWILISIFPQIHHLKNFQRCFLFVVPFHKHWNAVFRIMCKITNYKLGGCWPKSDLMTQLHKFLNCCP